MHFKKGRLMPGKGRSEHSGRQSGSEKKSSGAHNRAEAIEKMKERLLERREAITAGLQHNLSQSAPSITRGDSLDLAADSLASDTTLQIAERSSSELAQIDEALRKIAEGTYGICENCDSEIPWSRLEAAPYATLCVECKRKQELESSSEGLEGWSAVEEMEGMEPPE